MENCYFSYASYLSVLNTCMANLTLRFSIIISKLSYGHSSIQQLFKQQRDIKKSLVGESYGVHYVVVTLSFKAKMDLADFEV